MLGLRDENWAKRDSFGKRERIEIGLDASLGLRKGITISNCLLILTGTLEAHLTGDWCVSICGHYGLTIST